jgi:hypothetical protein
MVPERNGESRQNSDGSGIIRVNQEAEGKGKSALIAGMRTPSCGQFVRT